MNVRNIRVGLAALAAPAGFQVVDTVRESIAQLPAVVAGMPTGIDYSVSMGLARITLPLTLVFNASDWANAQKQMDAQLSDDTDSTVASLLLAAANTPTSAWQSVRLLRAENITEVVVGASKAFGVDLVLEVLAKKGA